MFLLNAILFRSPRYYQSHAINLPVLFQLFIVACRGIIGGFLLYYLTIFLNFGLNWEMVIHSPWTWAVLFLFGFGLVHVLILLFAILLPLQWLGMLQPIIDWLVTMILVVLFFGMYVISEVVGAFKHE